MTGSAFVFVVLLFLWNGAEMKIVKIKNIQKQKILLAQWESQCNMTSKTTPVPGNVKYGNNWNKGHCAGLWDNVMCWPDTPAGTTITQRCPSYFNGFNTQANATRICLSNSTWYHPTQPNSSIGWTDFSKCSTSLSPDDMDEKQVPDIFQEHIREIRIMYNLGYGLSLVSLIIALVIMLYFRRLHCGRNMIHVNLFMSFVLRAGISLVRDNLMVEGLGFRRDVAYNNSKIYFREDVSHWECRLFFTVFQYVLAASYVWIFVEALYLHMLIFVSVFTEKTRIGWYMLIGWVSPFLFVLPWVIARSELDNKLCWNTHPNPGLYWIIKGPVTATIVVSNINVLFFFNLIRVLFTKLNSSPCPEARKFRYRRLAKSTLVLIPMFGVYYVVFVCMSYTNLNLDETVEFVMLCIEMFFNSFQGVIIALLLCFLNAEVQTEIKKEWQRRMLRRESALSKSVGISHHTKVTKYANGTKVSDYSNGEPVYPSYMQNDELCAEEKTPFRTESCVTSQHKVIDKKTCADTFSDLEDEFDFCDKDAVCSHVEMEIKVTFDDVNKNVTWADQSDSCEDGDINDDLPPSYNVGADNTHVPDTHASDKYNKVNKDTSCLNNNKINGNGNHVSNTGNSRVNQTYTLNSS